VKALVGTAAGSARLPLGPVAFGAIGPDNLPWKQAWWPRSNAPVDVSVRIERGSPPPDARPSILGRGSVVEVQSHDAIRAWIPREGPDERQLDGVLEALNAAALLLAARHGGVALHACTLKMGAGVVVFAGQADDGKSTLYGRPDASPLQDEIAFVAPGPRGWQWWRSLHLRGEDRDIPYELPLRAICIFEPHRDVLAVTRLPLGDAIARLLERLFWPGGSPSVYGQAFLDHTVRLASEVPVLGFSHSLAEPLSALEAQLASMGL
jgi:hypothetical protein